MRPTGAGDDGAFGLQQEKHPLTLFTQSLTVSLPFGHDQIGPLV
jgi:hypothetical protein